MAKEVDSGALDLIPVDYNDKCHVQEIGVHATADREEVCGAPLELIRIDDHGKCHLQEAGAEVVSKIQGRLAVVGIAGLYRTGKSFLLNRLLGSQTGFQLGPSVNPCTKGLWIWSRPIELAPGYHCIFMDTEGLGSTQRTASCDMQILSLCILLSSNFIYNSIGAIDEQAIDDLHVVLHLAKHIHVKSGHSDEAERASELSQYFPSFLWVLRDFHLRLADENGGSITEKEYLEHALRPIPGQEDKNTLREVIKDLFRARDCATLVRPVSDEDTLRHIQQVPFESLRPQFQEQAEAFVRKVYGSLRPKTVQGSFVSGAALVGLAAEYCSAINSSAVPTIQSAWSSVVRRELRCCQREAMRLYHAKVRETITKRLPMSEDRLHELHRAAKAHAMEAFLAPRFDEVDPRVLECRQETASRIKQLHEDAKEENRRASRLLCEAVAAELYAAQIESKLCTPGAYRCVEQLMQGWEQLRRDYSARAGGPAQSEVLSTWLFQRMAESVQRLSDDLQRASDRRYGSLKQKYSEAESRRRRGESLERLLLSAPAVAERQLIPALAEQSRRYRGAVALRGEGLAAADRLHWDVARHQWRLRALEVQLRAASAAEAGLAADEPSRRAWALARSLAEIEAQRAAAVASLGEHASHYMLCPPACAIRRIEPGSAEAIEGLERLAAETYGEIAAEARGRLSVAPGDAGAQQGLRNELEGRRRLLQGQLEEAAAAWREATAAVALAGREALRAWSEVSAAAEGLLQAGGPPQPALLQAIAAAAAGALEAELLDPCGLCGLGGPDGPVASDPGGRGFCVPRTDSEVSQLEVDTFSPEARVRLVVSMLEFLRGAECLHRVGRAFLQQSSLGAALQAGGASGRKAGADGAVVAVGVFAAQTGPTAAGPLVPWLVESLVEATCQAAHCGDASALLGLLDACRSLGGVAFADAVRSRGSRTRVRRGLKPMQLAEAAGHERVAQLLRAWPDVEEPRTGDSGAGCLGLLRATASGLLAAPPPQGLHSRGQGSVGRRMKSALSAAVGWKSSRAYSAFGA